jgi:uncharacterized protein YdeI (YjbR/CyaY-like superfamily)
MTQKQISTGTVHKLPEDLRNAIISSPAVYALWQDITPLARNEWICWVISGKKAETRNIRIEKALSKLKGGMRRPCCWVGCTHRNDKKLSSSQKWVLSNRAK